MREIRTSGSMSGKWNRSLTSNRATSRLYFNIDVNNSGWRFPVLAFEFDLIDLAQLTVICRS